MEPNTLYMENVIFIMKSILESRGPSGSETASESLSACTIEPLMLNIVRYVRHLDPNTHSVQIKIKVCQLVNAMMNRHDVLTFRYECRSAHSACTTTNSSPIVNPT